MYAIIETGGKQYKVEKGDFIFVEKLNADENSKVKIDKVVAVSDDKKITAGKPYVDGASVEAKVVKNGKGKKINIFTYKPKKNIKRKMGHRQPYTKLEITAIKAK
ncbi:MAG: 50S ribosomal protein L21 [Clostridia bacterium]|nr:50S ribosomal protein L21 [Clostridia bacterium]